MPPRKLHIGGRERKQGWEIINAEAGDYVDHRGDAGELSRFEEATFDEIYASHVLEHFDYNGALQKALSEWHRVLKPGGILSISVPDMDILTQLFLAKDGLTVDERFLIMRMMFGGHIDQHDYHLVGLNQEFLTNFLTQAGFTKIARLDNFGLFEDTSSLAFKNIPISLNMRACKG